MRRNPVRRRRRRVAARTTYRRNPIRRRRRVSSYRRNPITHRRRRRVAGRSYRRNPSSRVGGKGGLNIMSLVVPGIMVGAGAVAAEMAMGYLPIPAAWKTGPMKYPVKAAVGIGLGMLVAKMVNRKWGELLALGSIVTASHDAIKDMVAGALPNAKFGSYNWAPYGYNVPLNQNFPRLGYYSAGQAYTPAGGMGQYVQGGMGAYVRPRGMSGANAMSRRGI